MLGKLIKHEFRATVRTVLPFYGMMLALAVFFGATRLIDNIEISMK